MADPRPPAAAEQLDPARLRALGAQLGRSAAAVAETLREELDRALGEIDAGLAAADAEAVALAAHAARNSALMIAARPTLTVLDELESAARIGDLETAAQGAVRLRERWIVLRAELARAR